MENALTPAQKVGLFFRETREAQHLSQEQLAALTSGSPGQVSRAMISAVERGQHLPGLEVLLTLSRALHVSPAEVLERLELSLSDPSTVDGMTTEQLEERASKRFWSGDFRGAVAAYDAVQEHLILNPPDDPEERGRRMAVLELRRGSALRRFGATFAARAAIERAIAATTDHPELQAQGYAVLAALLVQLGLLPLARDAADRAVEISASCDAQIRGWAWIEQGEVLSALGRFGPAREAFLKARQLVRQAGDTHHQINVEGNLGACLLGMGRLAQARTRFQRAVELARKFGSPASEAFWLVEVGRIALERDESVEADRHARASLRIAKPMGHLLTCFRAEWLRYLVRQRRRPGDADRHRIAYLKKLFVKLREHRGVREIKEFQDSGHLRLDGAEGGSS